MGRPSHRFQEPSVKHRNVAGNPPEFLEPGLRACPHVGHVPAYSSAPEGNPHYRTDRNLLARANGIGKAAVDGERGDVGNNPRNERDGQRPAAAASVSATSSASHENCGRPK